MRNVLSNYAIEGETKDADGQLVGDGHFTLDET
jgi:hypothetical protein